MIWLFILFVCMFVWSIFYRFIHEREDIRIIQTVEESNLNLSLISSFNGFGASLFSAFKTKHSDEDIKVYYVFTTIFFLPIMPVGCILAKKREKSIDMLGLETKYDIYGLVKMQFAEVMSSYALTWLAGAFICGWIIW